GARLDRGDVRLELVLDLLQRHHRGAVALGETDHVQVLEVLRRQVALLDQHVAELGGPALLLAELAADLEAGLELRGVGERVPAGKQARVEIVLALTRRRGRLRGRFSAHARHQSPMRTGAAELTIYALPQNVRVPLPCGTTSPNHPSACG